MSREVLQQRNALKRVLLKRKTTKPLSIEQLRSAAECLKTIAHPHRIRMVQMLLAGSYTVGELASACEIPSHMASEHLKLLERCQLLQGKRDGRSVYYSVTEPLLATLMECIERRFG
jgi:ArsR family transcriptional regulator, zinc-responsive transcriptional repressor